MYTDFRSTRAPAMLVGAVAALTVLSGCSDNDSTRVSRITGLPATVRADQAADYTLLQIDYPGATLTAPNGIDSRGDVVGRFIGPGGVRRGFFLDKHGSYEAIEYPGALATSAVGINAAATVVGEYSDATRNHGFALRGGTFSQIDFTVGTTVAHSTFAFGINSSGAVVGEYKVLFKPLGDPGHAFLFQDGVFTHISPPGARAAVAWAINASGQSVGYYMDQQVPSVGHGWRRDSDGTYATFDFPGATFTNARAINESGTIVGVYRDASQRSHGFMFEGDVFTRFDYPGAIFTRLSGINARGDIVGDFQDASGRTHGLLLMR